MKNEVLMITGLIGCVINIIILFSLQIYNDKLFHSWVGLLFIVLLSTSWIVGSIGHMGMRGDDYYHTRLEI